MFPLPTCPPLNTRSWPPHPRFPSSIPRDKSNVFPPGKKKVAPSFSVANAGPPRLCPPSSRPKRSLAPCLPPFKILSLNPLLFPFADRAPLALSRAAKEIFPFLRGRPARDQCPAFHLPPLQISSCPCTPYHPGRRFITPCRCHFPSLPAYSTGAFSSLSLKNDMVKPNPPSYFSAKDGRMLCRRGPDASPSPALHATLRTPSPSF